MINGNLVYSVYKIVEINIQRRQVEGKYHSTESALWDSILSGDLKGGIPGTQL